MKIRLLFVALIAVASAAAVLIGNIHDADTNVDENSDDSMIDYLGV